MNEEAIVLCSDAGQIERVKPLVSSIVNGGEWDGDIILITDVYNLSIWELKQKGVIVVRIDPDRYDKIFNFKDERNGKHPVGSLYRLLMFFFDTFKRWKQVLYLDIDTIVVNKIDFPPVDLLGASPEYCDGDHIHSVCFCRNSIPPGKYDYCNVRFESDIREEDRLISKHIFGHVFMEVKFNSGLIKLNPSAITEDIKRRILSISHSYSRFLVYPDQPILNMVFWKSWTDMGYDFGTQHWILEKNSERYLAQPIHHPYGLFYKPWDPDCRWHSHWKRFRDQFVVTKVKCSPEIEELNSSFKRDMSKYSDENIGKVLGEIEILDETKPFEPVIIKKVEKGA